MLLSGAISIIVQNNGIIEAVIYMGPNPVLWHKVISYGDSMMGPI